MRATRQCQALSARCTRRLTRGRRFKVETSPINLDRIQSWIDQGRLDPSRPITMRELHKSRCLHGVKRHGVKLLARVSSTHAPRRAAQHD